MSSTEIDHLDRKLRGPSKARNSPGLVILLFDNEENVCLTRDLRGSLVILSEENRTKPLDTRTAGRARVLILENQKSSILGAASVKMTELALATPNC